MKNPRQQIDINCQRMSCRLFLDIDVLINLLPINYLFTNVKNNLESLNAMLSKLVELAMRKSKVTKLTLDGKNPKNAGKLKSS